MAVRVAVNGLGRIGRSVLRAFQEIGGHDIEIVAANGPAPLEDHAHYLKYDSVHGTYPYDVRIIDGSSIDMGFGAIKIFGERDPAKLPWKELGIDVVMECTGHFEERAKAYKHIEAGAKKVIISAPSPDPDCTIVYKVNNEILKPNHQIISIGSCTTNCLAPVAKLLNDNIGIESGFMTTIHAYTNDQNILDGSHRDKRRARACALSIIPTSTGAAKALGQVLPELKGVLGGTAVRVPTPNVSMIDLSFIARKNTSIEEINNIMMEAANGKMKGVLAVEKNKLVSIDFNHNPHSSIFDLNDTHVINGKFCRIVAWYDNEWGYSVRMLDVAEMLR